MHDSVRAAWHAFSEPFEGRILHMYLDIKGLVTCGVGNLIDPVSEALKLPWKHADTGERATSAEVSTAWHKLKAAQDLSRKNTVHALALTRLVLTDADVDALVERKLAENDAYITKNVVPNFQDIPADAQLAILSMAWAVGPGLNRVFPIFTELARRGRWWDCASSGKIREEGNPGVVPRNRANRLCFENASGVAASNGDRSVLHWPNKFSPLASEEDPPPLAPPAGTIGEAFEAAAEAHSFDFEHLRKATLRELSGNEDPVDTDDEDEPTKPDLPGNV